MASRTPAQIEAQKAAALAAAKATLQSASQTASIESTPPGYITGFKIVLTPEYKIDIYPGVANVGGVRVQLGVKYTLKPEDEMMARLSRSWWYLYIDKLGTFYADVIPPEFKPEWMAYYHKNHPWRNIGRYFICDDHLCRYAANWQQASEQTVYVAPQNFGGIAGYYCTGVDDQILINAAIRYLSEAYSGGGIHLLRGNYSCAGIIDIPYDNIRIEGEGVDTHISSTARYAIKIGDGLAVSSGTTLSRFYISSTNIQVIYSNCNNATFTDLKIMGSATVVCDIFGERVVFERNIVDGNNVATVGVQFISTYGNISNNRVTNFTGDDAIGIYVADPSYGCRVDANSVDDIVCTNAGGVYCSGIRIAVDRVMVTNNYITACTNTATASSVRALDILSGSCVKIDHNYCFNNGSDTGIANTNGNNFYDGGTDTQVYSNSWQQPVANEPSYGTIHPCNPPFVAISTDTGPTGTTFYVTITSTQVPVGTRAVYMTGYQLSTMSAGAQWTVRDIASSMAHIYSFAPVTAERVAFSGWVRLSSTFGWKHLISSTNIRANETITGYSM